MADQQSEHDAIVEEVQQAILSEVDEIKKIVGEIQPGKPIDLTKLKALKAAVSGMSDALGGGSTPQVGKHNISFRFGTDGKESQGIRFFNNGCDDETAAALRGVFDAFKNGGLTQLPSDDKITTPMTFTDNGETETLTLPSLDQKKAADVAGLEAWLELAKTVAPKTVAPTS